jgi:hypothetical protein
VSAIAAPDAAIAAKATAFDSGFIAMSWTPGFVVVSATGSIERGFPRASELATAMPMENSSCFLRGYKYFVRFDPVFFEVLEHCAPPFALI